MIERVIRIAMEAGADDFYVVTGYREKIVRIFLAGLTRRLGCRITPVFNRDWEKENGLSVLWARAYLQEPFFLLMADHFFDPHTFFSTSLPNTLFRHFRLLNSERDPIKFESHAL